MRASQGRVSPRPRHLLVNLGFWGFSQKLFFHYFKWNSGGFGVSRRTAPTIRSYLQSFSRFAGTWGQKVHFSTFFGKLTFQCSRNGIQNHPFCPGPLQDTFIIYSSILHQHIFQKYLAKTEISRIENLEIWKSKHPGSLTGVHKAVAKAPVAKFFTKVGAKCAPHWNCTAPAKAPPTRIVSIVAPNLAHPPAGYWGRWGGVDGGVVASNVLRNNGNLWNLYEKPWNTDCSAFGEIHFRGGYFPKTKTAGSSQRKS